MAQSVQIPGTQENAKICNVIGVGALALIPFYLWFFWYRINKELAAYGQSKGTEECGTSPGKSLLAVTLGALRNDRDGVRPMRLLAVDRDCDASARVGKSAAPR